VRWQPAISLRQWHFSGETPARGTMATGTTRTMGWNDLIGRQLGQYTIVEEIGRGGSSRVYRSRDAEMQRDVAVKVIANDGDDRVGFVKRFQREVQAVAQLNHPNIVTVYDRGEDDDIVYLVMQCVLGGTFRQKLGRPLPTGEAASAVIQMAHALHHAHLRGIVHRDVKPSNMLIDAESPRHMLLTDFGIAKVIGTRGLTKTGTTIGTPEYMAPEQAEGKDIDPRADVYSLGCVLYETLAGRPPFIGSTPVSVLYQQVHSRPAYIRGFNPDVPRDLTRVIELALAKRPDDRYGTAERLAEALQPFAEERPPLHPVPALAAGQAPPERPSLQPEPLAVDPPIVATPPATAGSARSLAELGLVMPAAQHPGGLGAEGLDAIFPDDPEAQRSASAATPSSALPPAPPPPEPEVNPPTIPLPAFRLPPRQTRKLDVPLTASGSLDLDALLDQQPPPRYVPGGATPVDSYERAASAYSPPSEFMPDYAALYQDETAYLPGGPDDEFGSLVPGDGSDDPAGLLRSKLRRGGTPGEPHSVWRPPVENLVDDKRAAARRARRTNRRPLWLVLGLLAVLLLSVGTWVGVRASGLGVALFGSTHPTPVATHVPTLAPPTPTWTPAPTATATTNPQIAIDRDAAAAFRSVTLASFQDRSCAAGNATAHFAPGQTIYVNLCVAGNAPGGTMTVEIRQGGQTLYTLVSGQFASPGSTYWYSRYGLPAGQYDMRVTLWWNGNSGTARDLAFRVG